MEPSTVQELTGAGLLEITISSLLKVDTKSEPSTVLEPMAAGLLEITISSLLNLQVTSKSEPSQALVQTDNSPLEIIIQLTIYQ